MRICVNTPKKIKLDFFSVPDVKKVELVGVQPEKIFVQMQTAKLAQLGLDINSIANTIKAQTSVNASGMIEPIQPTPTCALPAVPTA